MARRKHSRKQIIQFVMQYGIHIWAILIIANVAMVYAYQFATHAASKSDTTLHALVVSGTPSPAVSLSPSPSPSPGALIGPGINLQFTVPGIGSGGGVMNPIHLKRNVTIFLFAPDVNSLNPTVKPLYTIQSYAIFDSDPYSPTYTSFLNPLIDLGSAVKDGNYQISFKTDQSLRTLIKENPGDLGGEVFSLGKGQQVPPIPPQTVLMGDIIPAQGDNMININDYNAFISCYGALNNSAKCQSGNFGDFNDDGIIDGIDYNILLRSLYAVSQEGLAVPELSPSPSIPKRVTKLIHLVTPTIKPNKNAPTKTPANTGSSNGGSVLGAFLFVLFLLVVGVIGYLLYKKTPNVRNVISSLIHMSPTGAPSSDKGDKTEETLEKDKTITSETPSKAPEQTVKTEQKEQTETSAPEPSKAGDILEKDCYIKTKSKDDTGEGMWLLLTDDYGAMNAHYSKSDVKDGFAKVKGVLKIENGKKFLEISELAMEG